MFALDSAPRYLALSYVWGAQYPQKEILLDNKSFAVTKTLYNFLLYFQKNDENRAGETYLWIVRLLHVTLRTNTDCCRAKSVSTNRVSTSEVIQ